MRSLTLKRLPGLNPADIALHDVAGMLIGVALPLVAAALYRTYNVAVSPNWLELTRQMGLPFVIGEMVIILWARRRGLDLTALVAALPALVRWAFLMFAGTFWISSVLISQVWSFSTALTMIWVVHFLFGAAVYYLASGRVEFDVARFAGWMSIGLALLGVWTAIHFLFPPAGLIINLGLTGWGGAVPGFISHRLFGTWAAALSVALLGLLWQAPSHSSSRLWLYSALILAVGVAVWTGTRAAVLGFAVGTAAAIWIIGQPASRDVYWKVPAALCVATLIGIALVPNNDPAFMFYRSGTYGTANDVSGGRIEFWLSALRASADHPWLGSGAASCWWLASVGGFRHVQPHNALIQFVLSWGLIATVPLLVLIGWATWRVHRVVRDVPNILPLVVMLDALLAMSMVDGVLYFSRFLMLVAALYGVCLARAEGWTR